MEPSDAEPYFVREERVPYGSNNPSPLRKKSFQWALNTAKALRGCYGTTFERHFAHQVVRSVTATGAAIEEANAAGSKKQFIYKIRHALQEANESKYWLSIIAGLQLIPRATTNTILGEGEEVRRILAAIIKTFNQRYGKAPKS